MKTNTGDGGESDFQGYHIIRFKCLVVNNNKINQKTYKETGMWIIQRKKRKSAITCLEKNLMTDRLDTDNSFKSVQEKKKDVKKVKLTMYKTMEISIKKEKNKNTDNKFWS